MTNFTFNKRLGFVIGGVILLLIMADVVLHIVVSPGRLRPVLEKTLTDALGRNVKVGDLKLAIFSGGVEATDLTIADDPAFSQTPFVRAESVKVSLKLAPLIFSRQLDVEGLTIEKPHVALIEAPGGTWNYSSVGSKTADPKTTGGARGTAGSSDGSSMEIGKVRISGGRISVTTHSATPMVLDNVDFDAPGIPTAAALPFTLSATMADGGAVKATGTVGPLNKADTAATPAQATLHVTHLDLVKAGVVDASAGIDGIGNLDATFSQTGDEARLDGTLKAEQWKAATKGTPSKRPLDFVFTITHHRTQEAGDVTRGDLHMGGAAATLTGQYDLKGKVPAIALTLAAPNLAGSDVGAVLPALGVVLPAGASLDGGTVSINLKASGPLDRLTTAGTVRVTNARLANFDLGTKLQALQGLGVKGSPHTEIQSLAASVESTPEVTKVDGIQVVIPSLGEVTGAGTVSASHALDFRMRIAVTAQTGLIAALGKVGSVPLLIQGTAENPKFLPDVGALAGDRLKSLITNKAGNQGAATSVIQGLFGRKPNR